MIQTGGVEIERCVNVLGTEGISKRFHHVALWERSRSRLLATSTAVDSLYNYVQMLKAQIKVREKDSSLALTLKGAAISRFSRNTPFFQCPLPVSS